MQVAVANMQNKDREFSHKLVKELLQKEEDKEEARAYLQVWNACVECNDIPLMKILSVGDPVGAPAEIKYARAESGKPPHKKLENSRTCEL